MKFNFHVFVSAYKLIHILRNCEKPHKFIYLMSKFIKFYYLILLNLGLNHNLYGKNTHVNHLNYYILSLEMQYLKRFFKLINF